MPLADRYAEMRAIPRLHERALFVSPRIPSELELQARWFAGDFANILPAPGIRSISFSLVPGTDFRDAAISVNGGESTRGCIELDLV